MDDEGCSGVRSANGFTPGVKKGKPCRRGAHVQHVLCDETNRIRRTRRWLCLWKAMWRDWTALVGGRDGSSHERTQETELQGIVDGLARNPREAVKKFEE